MNLKGGDPLFGHGVCGGCDRGDALYVWGPVPRNFIDRGTPFLRGLLPADVRASPEGRKKAVKYIKTVLRPAFLEYIQWLADPDKSWNKSRDYRLRPDIEEDYLWLMKATGLISWSDNYFRQPHFPDDDA